MSVGVAIFPVDGVDAESLIAEADRRMYQLKQQSKIQGEQDSASGNPEVGIWSSANREPTQAA